MCPNTVYSFNLSLPTTSAALYKLITATLQFCLVYYTYKVVLELCLWVHFPLSENKIVFLDFSCIDTQTEWTNERYGKGTCHKRRRKRGMKGMQWKEEIIQGVGWDHYFPHAKLSQTHDAVLWISDISSNYFQLTVH